MLVHKSLYPLPSKTISSRSPTLSSIKAILHLPSPIHNSLLPPPPRPAMACCPCFAFKRSRSWTAPHVQDHHIQNLPNESNNGGKSCVRRFQWEEVVRMTGNFSRTIGEGGFSTVYLGFVLHGSCVGQVAVKVHRSSERLHRAFKQELDVLMHVRHENIVKLLGYCDDREEGVLVFELLSNGTLHDNLRSNGSLSWPKRMSIAYEVARAVHHLHESCDLQIVHCDITSLNVLLDSNLTSKICDFGFAKMGFSSTILPSSANPVLGSPGYLDPYYLRTGIISKKNDVYSFGVLVMELITGLKAFCEERQQLLTATMAEILGEPTRAVEVVDRRLGGGFDREEAVAMAALSAACLEQQPSLRPTIAEVLKIMEQKVSSHCLEKDLEKS